MSRAFHAALALGLLGSCLLLRPAALGRAETFIWVDPDGRTHLSDDAARVPDWAREQLVGEGEALSDLWSDGWLGPPHDSDGDTSSREDDRATRMFRDALEDLRRGETARATASLEAILRLHPDRPEAHYVLALLDRRRGRLDSAESHLHAFLAAAGDGLEAWRRAAQRQLLVLADERRLADPKAGEAPARWREFRSAEIEVRYDAELGDGSPQFAVTVMRYLQEAREEVGRMLGVVPKEPTRAVLYGRARYRRVHAGRFSFSTVGFYDGRIHVISAAHPAGELRSLLFHEYCHALFREHTGGDRPYWLNEGLAELAERRSRRQPDLARSERQALRQRIEVGGWIPLRRLAPSFAGLRDEEARIAYLEAAATASWILSHTEPAERARLLSRLAAGAADDEALLELTGLDTAALDAAVRERVLATFARAPL